MLHHDNISKHERDLMWCIPKNAPYVTPSPVYLGAPSLQSLQPLYLLKNTQLHSFWYKILIHNFFAKPQAKNA